MAAVPDPTRPLPRLMEVDAPARSLAGTDAQSVPAAEELPTDGTNSPTILLSEPIGSPGQPPSIFQHPALKGYVLLHCLENTPFGSTWKVQSPSGTVKILYHFHGLNPERAAAGVRQLQKLDHPFLTDLKLLCGYRDQLLLLGENLHQTLRHRFAGYWKRGLPGISPAELAGLLQSVADTLDSLFAEEGLHHLALNPDQLAFRGESLLIEGFGLMQMLWLPDRWLPSLVNPRYSAPEIFQNRYTPKSDQYSLALIWAEMRTGAHPFGRLAAGTDKSPNQSEPDLQLLPTPEQEVIRKALSLHPFDRLANCRELIKTLGNCGGPKAFPVGLALPPSHNTPVPDPDSPSEIQVGAGKPFLTLVTDAFLQKLETVTTGGMSQRRVDGYCYYLDPGICLEHTFYVRATPDQLQIPLVRFREEWDAQLVENEELSASLIIEGEGSWLSWFGRSGGSLRMGLEVSPHRFRGLDFCVLTATFTPQDCSPDVGRRLLEVVAPEVVTSLREFLGAGPDLRGEKRWECKHPLRVLPVYHDLNVLQSVECLGKDISTRGIGFFAPGWLPASSVYIQLPWLPQFRDVAIRATIVRATPRRSGWFEIGAKFER